MTVGVSLCRLDGLVWLIFAATFSLVPPAVADAPAAKSTVDKVFVAAVVRESQPLLHINKKGKPVGFARDVMRDIARLAGIRIDFRVVGTVEEALRQLDDGRIDLIPNLAITPGISQSGSFTAPVETVAISLFVRRAAEQISRIEDLRGKQVGIMRLNSELDVVSKVDAAIPVVRDDVQSAIADLMTGKLDAVISAKQDFQYAARQLGLDTAMYALGPPLLEISRAILVTKREPALLAVLDSAVGQYVGTPAYHRVFLKWYDADRAFLTVSNVVWLMGGLALVGLVASFWWRSHSVARLNRRLTEQTAVLRTVLDNADQGISLFDGDLKAVAINSRLIELLGLPPELGRVGMPFEDLVRFVATRGDYGTGEREVHVRERIKNAVNPLPRNFVRRAPGGLTVDVRKNSIPDGGFVITYTDISDRVRAEDALRISEKQLSQAQRIGKIGHWRYLIETKRFECSDAFYRIYGWDPATFTASFAAIAAAVHPEDHARISAVRMEAGKRKEAYRCEFRIIRSDGEIRFVHGEGRPEFDDSGKLVSFFGVNKDITEQKQIEEELLQERTRAELANRAKSEFLANMSHEIRTPLNAIIGFADIIKKEIFGPVGNEKYGEYVGDIHASAEHLLDLVNDILDISTIEAGELPLSPVDLNLAELFDECVRVVREQARKAKISLHVEGPDSQVSVFVDRRAVRQILLNLLSNAIKFTPPGGQVTVRAEGAEDIFTIVVTDSGIGIPSDQLPTITQPFETGSDDPHTSSKGNPYVRAKGTGLGLAIVRSLAKLHGGGIDISSEVGVGTSVRVWFPWRKREAA